MYNDLKKDMYTIDFVNNMYEPWLQEKLKSYIAENISLLRIGDLYWTVENLKTTKLNDGTEIELITDNEKWKDAGVNNIPAYCYYDNDLSNKQKYGVLYNFHAVSTGKLAPEGWRVPTDEDWKCLENYLINNGFSALPGGFRGCDGYFHDIGRYDYWWSATEFSASSAYYRYLYYNEYFDRHYFSKGCGFSVRLVRDVF